MLYYCFNSNLGRETFFYNWIISTELVGEVQPDATKVIPRLQDFNIKYHGHTWIKYLNSLRNYKNSKTCISHIKVYFFYPWMENLMVLEEGGGLVISGLSLVSIMHCFFNFEMNWQTFNFSSMFWKMMLCLSDFFF